MARNAGMFTERIAVFFTKEQLEKIKAEAERQGLTVSAYIRMLVVRVVSGNG